MHQAQGHANPSEPHGLDPPEGEDRAGVSGISAMA
jgi:hypothetical protein